MKGSKLYHINPVLNQWEEENYARLMAKKIKGAKSIVTAQTGTKPIKPRKTRASITRNNDTSSTGSAQQHYTSAVDVLAELQQLLQLPLLQQLQQQCCIIPAQPVTTAAPNSSSTEVAWQVSVPRNQQGISNAASSTTQPLPLPVSCMPEPATAISPEPGRCPTLAAAAAGGVTGSVSPDELIRIAAAATTLLQRSSCIQPQELGLSRPHSNSNCGDAQPCAASRVSSRTAQINSRGSSRGSNNINRGLGKGKGTKQQQNLQQKARPAWNDHWWDNEGAASRTAAAAVVGNQPKQPHEQHQGQQQLVKAPRSQQAKHVAAMAPVAGGAAHEQRTQASPGGGGSSQVLGAGSTRPTAAGPASLLSKAGITTAAGARCTASSSAGTAKAAPRLLQHSTVASNRACSAPGSNPSQAMNHVFDSLLLNKTVSLSGCSTPAAGRYSSADADDEDGQEQQQSGTAGRWHEGLLTDADATGHQCLPGGYLGSNRCSCSIRAQGMQAGAGQHGLINATQDVVTALAVSTGQDADDDTVAAVHVLTTSLTKLNSLIQHKVQDMSLLQQQQHKHQWSGSAAAAAASNTLASTSSELQLLGCSMQLQPSELLVAHGGADALGMSDLEFLDSGKHGLILEQQWQQQAQATSASPMDQADAVEAVVEAVDSSVWHQQGQAQPTYRQNAVQSQQQQQCQASAGAVTALEDDDMVLLGTLHGSFSGVSLGQQLVLQPSTAHATDQVHSTASEHKRQMHSMGEQQHSTREQQRQLDVKQDTRENMLLQSVDGVGYLQLVHGSSICGGVEAFEVCEYGLATSECDDDDEAGLDDDRCGDDTCDILNVGGNNIEDDNGASYSEDEFETITKEQLQEQQQHCQQRQQANELCMCAQQQCLSAGGEVCQGLAPWRSVKLQQQAQRLTEGLQQLQLLVEISKPRLYD